MKHIILGLAIAGLSFACQSQPKTSVGEADAMPKAECGSGECCDEGMKSECTGEKKGECSTGGEVCPVTGKPVS